MNEIVTERPNLFEPNVYITVCVENAGKVSPHKLSAAVKQAFFMKSCGSHRGQAAGVTSMSRPV